MPGTIDVGAALVHVWLERRDAEEIDQHMQSAADQSDPRAGVLVRFVWMQDRNGVRPDLMWLVIHHLAVDGVSWRIILTDLARAWQQISDCVDPDLGRDATSVRRWAPGSSSGPPTGAPPNSTDGPKCWTTEISFSGRGHSIRTVTSEPPRTL